MERSRRGEGCEVWEQRIRRWKESGLTARQFTSKTGIKLGALKYWTYTLAKEAKIAAASSKPRVVKELGDVAAAPSTSGFVRLAATADERFELDLGQGRRLLIPRDFDADALKRLISVLREVP